MIKPNKFLDLDSCIINISGEITKILLQRNSIKYNDLYEILKNMCNTIRCDSSAPDGSHKVPTCIC